MLSVRSAIAVRLVALRTVAARTLPQRSTAQWCHACQRTLHTASYTRTQDASSSASSSSPFVRSGSSPSTQLYQTFNELGLDRTLVNRLTALGVKQPTPIQQRVLPALKEWSRTPVLVQAPTGTGKSLAFLLPTLERLLADESERIRANKPRTHVSAVLLCPTQELVFQTQAQIHALLADHPVASKDSSFMQLMLGGVDSVEQQRDDLLTKPVPALLLATPKRLNQVIFPQYDTHGKRPEKHVILDPVEDEGDEKMPKDQDYFDDDDAPPESQGRGETHRAPKYSVAKAAEATSSLTEQEEYANRNNIAVVSGGVRSEKVEISSEERHRRDLLQEDRDELDGIKSENLPPRYAVGYQAARFLETPYNLAKKRLRSSVGHKLFSQLRYIILDEIDGVLRPWSKYMSPTEKEKRARHPKPAQVLVKGLALLNPDVQLVGASATISGQLTRLLFLLGFSRKGHKPLLLRIEPRLGLQSAAQSVYEQTHSPQRDVPGVPVPKQLTGTTTNTEAQGKQQEETVEVYIPGRPAAASAAITPQVVSKPPSLSSPSPYRPPQSFSSWLTSPNSNAMEPPRSANVPQLAFECPTNLKHFYVLAPSMNAWIGGTYGLSKPDAAMLANETGVGGVGGGGGKLKYDYHAPEEERQKVHEQNMIYRLAQRRSAHVLDKLIAVSVLHKQFKPKCCILTIDETKTNLKLSQAKQMLKSLGMNTTLVYEHLSSPDPTVRSKFFHDLELGTYDLLLVSTESLRGLDLPLCDLVFNLATSASPAAYLHAAGRTGRFGKIGSVMTILHSEESEGIWERLRHIMPETLGGAKQITLPKLLPADRVDQILRAYELYSSDRAKELHSIEKDISRKLRKQVRPDSAKSPQEKKELRRLKQAQRKEQKPREDIEDNSDPDKVELEVQH